MKSRCYRYLESGYIPEMDAAVHLSGNAEEFKNLVDK